jgi:23S rRNA (cytosine1962-C5)-methyltransferase
MPDSSNNIKNRTLTLLLSPQWEDYELVDSGNGQKLERYGPYEFIRPEPQAIWKPALKEKRWQSAHAVFQPTREESGGHWVFKQPVEPNWIMRYAQLRFQVQTTAGRHLGVFPEQAVHWDWIRDTVLASKRQIQVLNLFGYTGLASLSAAQAGARVTHVDASKKALQWARQNQEMSGLSDRPIRWLLDDAMKFVQREARRGAQYDGIILDPPKFGRGPKGEVWEFFDLFPRLLEACRAVLGPNPLFIVITAYAIRASSLSLHFSLQQAMDGLRGTISSGELALQETSSGRLIPTAIFARWSSTGQPSS